MKGVKVIDPGLYSLIQDEGRKGYRKYGMPVSGIMDFYSYRLANWLVNNHPDEAVIETTLKGPEIQFLSASIFAVTGADIDLFLNGRKISTNESHKAKKGSVLRCGGIRKGLRNYIAFSGGLRIDPVMNSKSTYVRAGIGGHKGKKLSKGNILPLYPSLHLFYKKRKARPEKHDFSAGSISLRITEGLDFSKFNKQETDNFFNKVYTVDVNSDRMGLRLNGPVINSNTTADLISYPLDYGTIQITGNGQPIIMGADCQTIGGYPQIGKVITADLPILGQIRPGQTITFTVVSTEEAVEAYRDINNEISEYYARGRKNICIDCYTS